MECKQEVTLSNLEILMILLFCRNYLLVNGYKIEEKESVKVETVAAKSSAILTSLIKMIVSNARQWRSRVIKEVGARPLIRVIESTQICNSS